MYKVSPRRTKNRANNNGWILTVFGILGLVQIIVFGPYEHFLGLCAFKDTIQETKGATDEVDDSQPIEESVGEEKKKKELRKTDCQGFPEWPLPPSTALYDDQVGSPQCRSVDSSYRWVLHQTSKPNRRPSKEEVETLLSDLPTGTGYVWHSDEDICIFMRTQPLRFQALYNHLENTAHKMDLWRYLWLYERGGIYLDDDAFFLVKFNSSFVNYVDSVYMTQGNSPKSMGTVDNDKLSPFGYTIFNGFLISKPCNSVLLSVAESMMNVVPGGKQQLQTWSNQIEHPHLVYWYNLKLLARAIAERAPKALLPDPKCKAGTSKCTFFERDTSYKSPYGGGRDVIVYKDDHDWKTAVFDVAQCKMPVSQVKGGKHDSLAPENPHPSPWFPAKENRMIFTHVGMSGGSYLINLMKALQKRNGFKLVKGADLSGFNPSKQKLVADLRSMENNTIYENHANYVEGLDDHEWLSMVQDPLALTISLYYYAVDKEIRGGKAKKELDRRKNDTICGCFGLEFDECINTKYENNCTIELAPQMSYYCEPKDPSCNLDLALRHAENYVLVGITEEMELTIAMLESLSPWVFRGQAEALTVKASSANLFNPITNTKLNWATSTRMRKQIKERAINYRDEIEFYDAVRRMFWRKAVELGSVN